MAGRHIPLGIGALSYAGQFNITVVADQHTCPDAELFTVGLRACLNDLAKPVPCRRKCPRKGPNP